MAMQIIGHKSPLMWKRYNSVAESDLLQAANKLSSYLSNTVIAPADSSETIQVGRLERCGAGERNRTSNLRFTKPLLCRLSYASPLVTGCPHIVSHSINRLKSLSRKLPRVRVLRNS
jgi:hypothetical protein